MNRKIGNILEEVKTGIIVQQVNAQGVMASGIAKSIREEWPNVYTDYIVFIKTTPTEDRMGRVIWSKVGVDLRVACIVGQNNYGRDHVKYTSYDALDDGFKMVSGVARFHGDDVHYPLIGCGLGGGEWSIVSAIINARLDTINHTLWELPSK